jgi:hypothetical protein
MANWEHLKYSNPMILSVGIAGLPFVGGTFVVLPRENAALAVFAGRAYGFSMFLT